MTNQELMLRFMEATIEKVNICLSSIYALEVLLIEKGLVTQDDMIHRIQDSKTLPQTKIGKQILDEMIKGTSFEGKSFMEMIDWEETQKNIEKANLQK
jgi:hypothetical protein